MPRLLRKGDRIRLKVRTICGWKGTGTVTEDQLCMTNTITFSKDDAPHQKHCLAARHEVTLLRNQTNNTKGKAGSG